MDSEMEAVGALATASLTASALEHETAQTHAHGACANCGTVLAGPFCHQCGQVGHLHRSMFHIVEEFFHGILHFDGKVWRTLPLLALRPGKLTRDYIHGHRVRYVTPLALFLFTAFLMFMIFSMLGGGSNVQIPAGMEAVAAREALSQELTRAQADLNQAEAELATARAADEGVAGAERSRAAEQQAVAKAEAALRALDEMLALAGDGQPAAPTDNIQTNSGVIGAIKNFTGDGNFSVNIGNKSLEEKIAKKLKNPELLLYKIQNTAYKFSWMLVPISLPFLWLLFFWRRDVAMYDHAIFALYSLSFMSLLFITISLLYSLGDGIKWIEDVAALLCFAPPVHMYFHLKGTYALTRGETLWRTVALMFITLTTSLLFISFIVSMGFTG